MKLTAYVDGGGKWRDRPAYIGLYIYDTDNPEMVLVEEGLQIGDATNNEAEYSAVGMAVYYAKEFGAKELQVYSDSKLVVNQLRGEWRINADHIGLYHDEIKQEIEGLDFKIDWIPRSENKRADKIGRTALGS